MAWQKVTMTPEQVAYGEGAQLQDAFEKEYIAANAPDGVAMFGERETAGSFSYYFSPAAVRLFSVLDAFGASDTTPPNRDEAALLVGHADARDTLPDGES